MQQDDIDNYKETPRTLVKGDGFVYLLPHQVLRPWISNYTISFPPRCKMTKSYAVIPHGCATLVFSCDDRGIRGHLFGPTTKPACVGSEANRSLMLFIAEFQPGGYYAFSGMPQGELTDCVIPFAWVNPALNRLMEQQIETAQGIHSLVAEIDRLFLAHLKGAFFRGEFSRATKMIIESGGQATVRALSRDVSYSERHLGRIFGEYLGVNIKPFSRLVRINKAIRLLRRPQYSLTQVYLEAGYYDLPHFVHDFKATCGLTPQVYRENMSDFYSEIAKY